MLKNQASKNDPYIKAYQVRRAEAHEAADRDGFNYVVVNTEMGDREGNGDHVIQPESEPLPIGSKVSYIARPGTVTYLTYLSQCNAEGVSALKKNEWVREGRLSLINLRLKWGIKTSSQKNEEEREKRREEKKAEEAVKPEKKKKVLKEGKSSKVIVFDAYSSGETDLQKLFKLVDGLVKEVTIKSWIASWKRGKNLPAGRTEGDV